MDLLTVPISLLIKKISDRQKQHIDRGIASDDITREQGHLLMTLYHRGNAADLTMKELEGYFRVAQSSLVGMVSRLEKKGFVRTYRDEQDKRVKHVCLTDSGRGNCIATMEKMERHERELVAGLTEAEQAELRRLLGLLYTTLNRDQEEIPGQKGQPEC